ncbi:MAG: AAA family ATPase [Syntrophorhabdus sp.]
MPKIIAFAGKGGVGKTTIAGILIRYLVEELKGGPVLAVDADPNSNLNEILGVDVRTTIGEARELMKKDVPKGMTKDVWFEYKVHEAIIEGKGFDLLVMGRPEGPGCYCAANSLAKQSIETLKGNYPFVVADNEAGMEHMSRLVTQNLDHLYVVSDPSPRGLLTAKRILDLIGELNLTIKNWHIIVNRVKGGEENSIGILAQDKGLKITGFIRDDMALVKADSEGISIFSMSKESVVISDAYSIFARSLEARYP